MRMSGHTLLSALTKWEPGETEICTAISFQINLFGACDGASKILYHFPQPDETDTAYQR